MRTEFYKFDGGLTSVKAKETRGGHNLFIRTEIPRLPFRMRGSARTTDEGVVSFSLQAYGRKGSTHYTGTRDAHGVTIQYHGVGFHGKVFFEESAWDLTSLDVMVLDEHDIKDIPDGQKLRVLDILDLEIESCRIKNRLEAQADGTQLRHFEMDFGEGHLVAMTFDCKTNTMVRGRDGALGWSKIDREEITSHLETMHAAT